MKKIIKSIFLTGIITALTLPPLSQASEGWEANINVSSGNAESRLSFGQMPDATDLTDGLYDVPAMLSGSLQVYFQNEDGSFWRDIRRTGSYKEWRVIIISKTESPIKISWDPTALPQESEVRLVSDSRSIKIDMKNSNEYTLDDNPESLLLIEVSNN